MCSAHIVSACLNFFGHLCSAKNLPGKKEVHRWENEWEEVKTTHINTHFEMKNKPKFNLY